MNFGRYSSAHDIDYCQNLQAWLFFCLFICLLFSRAAIIIEHEWQLKILEAPWALAGDGGVGVDTSAWDQTCLENSMAEGVLGRRRCRKWGDSSPTYTVDRKTGSWVMGGVPIWPSGGCTELGEESEGSRLRQKWVLTLALPLTEYNVSSLTLGRFFFLL